MPTMRKLLASSGKGGSMTRGQRYGRVVAVRDGRIIDKSPGKEIEERSAEPSVSDSVAPGRVVSVRDGEVIDREDALNKAVDAVEPAEDVEAEEKPKAKKRGRPKKSESFAIETEESEDK